MYCITPVQCSAVQCNILNQCSAVQCSAVQSSAMQCNTLKQCIAVTSAALAPGKFVMSCKHKLQPGITGSNNALQCTALHCDQISRPAAHRHCRGQLPLYLICSSLTYYRTVVKFWQYSTVRCGRVQCSAVQRSAEV